MNIRLNYIEFSEYWKGLQYYDIESVSLGSNWASELTSLGAEDYLELYQLATL